MGDCVLYQFFTTSFFDYFSYHSDIKSYDIHSYRRTTLHLQKVIKKSKGQSKSVLIVN